MTPESSPLRPHTPHIPSSLEKITAPYFQTTEIPHLIERDGRELLLYAMREHELYGISKGGIVRAFRNRRAVSARFVTTEFAPESALTSRTKIDIRLSNEEMLLCINTISHTDQSLRATDRHEVFARLDQDGIHIPRILSHGISPTFDPPEDTALTSKYISAIHRTLSKQMQRIELETSS